MMKMCSRTGVLSLTAVFTLCGLAASATAQPSTFTGISPTGTGTDSVAKSVSADGTVVAITSFSFSSSRSGRWVFPGPSQAIGTINNANNSADTMTRDGQTIYGSTSGGSYRWTNPGPMTADPVGRTLDISADGQVRIVDNQRQVGNDPPQSLGLPGGFEEGYLRAIDGDGDTIIGQGYTFEPGGGYGYRGSQVFTEAAVWTESNGWEMLGYLPGDNQSNGLLISDDGTVLVGTSGDDNERERRTWRKVGAGPLVDLGTLEGFEDARVTPTGMSADGSTIIGELSGSGFTSFIWTEADGMQDLEAILRNSGQNLTGWSVPLSFTAISADGQYVIGNGVINNRVSAFIAPIFATCDSPAAGAPESTDLIALQSAPALGEPGAPNYVNFQQLPSIANDGEFAHRAGMSDGLQRIFVGPPPAAVVQGTAGPGGTTYTNFASPIVVHRHTDGGRCEFSEEDAWTNIRCGVAFQRADCAGGL